MTITPERLAALRAERDAATAATAQAEHMAAYRVAYAREMGRTLAASVFTWHDIERMLACYKRRNDAAGWALLPVRLECAMGHRPESRHVAALTYDHAGTLAFLEGVTEVAALV